MTARRTGERFEGRDVGEWLVELEYLPADALARMRGDDPLWPWLLDQSARAVDCLRLATWMDATTDPRAGLVARAMARAAELGPTDDEWWDADEWLDTLESLRALSADQRAGLRARMDPSAS